MINDANRHARVTYNDMVAGCERDPAHVPVLLACLLYELDLLAKKVPNEHIVAAEVSRVAGVSK